ncbi:MAG: hypothetical protein MI867_27555 [Pseudomonadales bacterium]|nr:hypothetical protein [Pseudomonadales bacterium]
MEVNATYDVVASGELVDGFQQHQVQAAFADLFKCSPEKAQAVVGKRVVLKKKVDKLTAEAYQAKLHSIGLAVELDINTPRISPTLALEPTEEELRAQEAQQQTFATNSNSKAATQSATQSTTQPAVDNHRMVCPKCGLEQLKAPQCSGCGVYIHKVMKADEPSTARPEKEQGASVVRSSRGQSESRLLMYGFSFAALAGASVVAVLGAVLWKTLAFEFDREYAIVAWAIGGAVGLTAAMFGSRGQGAGTICAILAVCAIMGGKYLFYADLQANISSAFEEMGSGDMMRAAYDEWLVEAEAYGQVTNDQSLRQFMYDYDYVDYASPDQITSSDIEEFKQEYAQSFDEFGSTQPTYDEWMNNFVAPEIQSISTFDVVQESLGWLDLLFIFMGVASAYRIGSRGE